MTKVKLCSSSILVDSGNGFRFKVTYNLEETSAFAIRINGQVHSYLNRCSHLPVELDWNYANFLDESGFNIVCATHGALYEAVSGQCLGGPCSGRPLIKLTLTEENGFVYWMPTDGMAIPENGIED